MLKNHTIQIFSMTWVGGFLFSKNSKFPIVQISELFLFLLLDLLVILGYQKWHFGCPNQNSESTFIDQNHPQNPQKDTLGTQIGPQKVIFSHFFYFVHFPIEIPIVVEKSYSPWEGKVLEQKQK